jgi:rfaE bifunctional protein nucleotidyltransferase chain/domain
LGAILNRKELIIQVQKWHTNNKIIVFTNGCFDLIHRGHVEYLNQAKSYGDLLIVGVNSDESVKQLKGENRPYVNEDDRAYIVSQLLPVDYVYVFNEDNPYDLIKLVEPNILIKGSDYSLNEIIGRDLVEKKGGCVITIPLFEGRSTTDLIKKIQQQNNRI